MPQTQNTALLRCQVQQPADRTSARPVDNFGSVDRLPLRNEEVRGSIPLGSTTASPDTVATICLLPEPLPDEFGATRPPTRPNMAEQARTEMGVETLDAVADRGYYDSEEIRACEES